MILVAAALALLVPQATMESWLERQGWSLGQLADGQCPISLEDAQRYLIARDPVLWVERHLVEREEGGARLWRLFDYQKESLRYRGHTLHRCGAEVGKTREIVGLALWKGMVYERSQLIAAAQDGHLESLWDELTYQCQQVPPLTAAVDWERTRVKPYRKLAWKSGAFLHLRPAGLAGEAFRGLHVHDLYFDEAALVTAERVWIEFFRALLPDGERRIYSTPNGLRDTRYAQLARRAVVASSYLQAHPEAVDPLGVPMLGTPEMRRWMRRRPSALRFQWSKEQMPPPFWTPERRREALEVYGGPDSPGYRQNVLGEDGDAADSVFPHGRLVPLCRHLPEYRHLELRIDRGAGQLTLSAWALEEGFRLAARTPGEAGAVDGAEAQAGEAASLRDRRPLAVEEAHPLGGVEWLPLLAAFVERLEGRLVGGIDVGWSRDPTEIVVDRAGKAVRWCLRVTLHGFESPEQRAVVAALDRLLEPELGWGLDATGAGTPLEQELRATSPRLREAVEGYVWNVKTDDRHPMTGAVLLDRRTGAPRRVSLKELATRLLEHRMQTAGLEYPLDLGVITEWTSHTATLSRTGTRVFAHRRDHTIDAQRAAELKLFFAGHGAETPPVEYLEVHHARRRLVGAFRKW